MGTLRTEGQRDWGQRPAWMNFLGFSLGLLLCFSESAQAQIGSSIQLNLDLQKERLAIAEAWAPVIYQDTHTDPDQIAQTFFPEDQIVGFFFDGNQDLQDNRKSIFELTAAQQVALQNEVPLYFSLIESATHYYLNYVVYHAVDTAALGHAHDTENIFLVIKKDGSKRGELEAMITNAHGYPMIYSSDTERAELWRSKVHLGMGQKFLPYLDRGSAAHHRHQDIEYVRRRDSLSPKVFIATRSHAIYRFDREAFLTQSIPQDDVARSGIFYISKACGECAEDPVVRSWKNRITYNLVDFDAFVEQQLALPQQKVFAPMLAAEQNADEASDDSDAVRAPDQEPADQDAAPDDDSYVVRLYQKRKLPTELIAGIGESHSSANLFHENSFRTPFELSDPARMHRFLNRGAPVLPTAVADISRRSAVATSEDISLVYYQNFYLEAYKAKEKPAKKKPLMASLWPSLASVLRSLLFI